MKDYTLKEEEGNKEANKPAEKKGKGAQKVKQRLLPLEEKLEKEMINIKETKDDNENSLGISFDLNNNNNYSSFSLSKPEEFSLKKKWYEESVFKNQSRKEEKLKKRFINDSVHSDFHYRFLDKAIQ